MRLWLHRLMGLCRPWEADRPLFEDQRYWTCPDCSRVWEWAYHLNCGHEHWVRSS